jgi:hypothetical protein
MILEQRINQETCLKKIKAMTNIVISDFDIKCYNCMGNYSDCENYTPVRNHQERYRHLNLYLDKQ